MAFRVCSDFVYNSDEDFEVSEDMLKSFDQNGYVIVRSLLTTNEVERLKTSVEKYRGIVDHEYGRRDGKGRYTRLCTWNYPGEDVTGTISRCNKVAGSMEKFLGGEIYHYHAKLIMKDAQTGGEFVWHQDYGYWYKNGCVFPDMGSVFIAVDEASQENGCLQILSGSHKLGRIDHVRVGGQAGADLERVEHAKKSCDLVYLEMKPGDACFFHCNILHTSAQNHSDKRRWAFIVAYNRATNDPVIEQSHAPYTPLQKVPDSAIEMCQNFTDLAGKDFYDPRQDSHRTLGSIDSNSENMFV